MTLATDLRAFLLAIPEFPIDQVHQAYVPEQSDAAQGFVYFARRGSAHLRTTDGVGNPADEHSFDIEIYHSSIDTAEAAADLIQQQDCFHGSGFGDGSCGAFLVDSQTDDYVPRVQFTDDVAFHAAYLSVEVRGYLPGV